MKLTCSTNKLKLSRKRKRKRWDLLWVPGYIVSYKQLIKTYKWIMTMWKYAHVRDIRKEINFWWYCYYYSSTQVDHDELIMHGSCKRCFGTKTKLDVKTTSLKKLPRCMIRYDYGAFSFHFGNMCRQGLMIFLSRSKLKIDVFIFCCFSPSIAML